MEFDEEKGEAIDWEAPFDVVRSSEVNDITLEFLDDGMKLYRTDDSGEAYTLFSFACIRRDISNPREIVYTTSSKGLIDALQGNAPIKGKTLVITKTGSGFQTRYNAREL